VKEGATLVFSYVGFLLEKAVTAAVMNVVYQKKVDKT
jgi:hypothetical protein